MADACIAHVAAHAFRIPTDGPEADGTLAWKATTLLVVEVEAGEPFYFRRMLEAGAVDVLQADATRCGGYTGFLRVAALADAWGIPLSAHTAPALHLPVCCAAPRLRNIEWFHDHVRIEQMVFDGAPRAQGGHIRPDLSRPGHGLTLRRKDAERLSA